MKKLKIVKIVWLTICVSPPIISLWKQNTETKKLKIVKILWPTICVSSPIISRIILDSHLSISVFRIDSSVF